VWWSIQAPGWALFVYLVVAQGIAALDYDLGVAMGTQEPAEVVTEVGTAFWLGFAVADLVCYIPILALGLIAHLRGSRWWRVAVAAAGGITVYWPVVCLVALVAARGAEGWSIASETPYWIVLPAIVLWGAWVLIAAVLPAKGPGHSV
jgi:hypothetical protein